MERGASSESIIAVYRRESGETSGTDAVRDAGPQAISADGQDLQRHFDLRPVGVSDIDALAPRAHGDQRAAARRGGVEQRHRRTMLQTDDGRLESDLTGPVIRRDPHPDHAAEGRGVAAEFEGGNAVSLTDPAHERPVPGRRLRQHPLQQLPEEGVRRLPEGPVLRDIVDVGVVQLADAILGIEAVHEGRSERGVGHRSVHITDCRHGSHRFLR